MVEMNNNTFAICFDNNICDFQKYTFSPALSFEFYDLRSEDGIVDRK